MKPPPCQSASPTPSSPFSPEQQTLRSFQNPNLTRSLLGFQPVMASPIQHQRSSFGAGVQGLHCAVAVRRGALSIVRSIPQPLCGSTEPSRDYFPSPDPAFIPCSRRSRPLEESPSPPRLVQVPLPPATGVQEARRRWSGGVWSRPRLEPLLLTSGAQLAPGPRT